MISIVVGMMIAAKPVICIDPGHPSEVGPGTKGKSSTEMVIAWEVAKELRDRLKVDGYTVVMTKASLKEKVTNRQRAAIATASKASLMLRLHCDAASGSGFTVYYPTQQGKSGDVTGPTKEVLTKTAPVAKAFYAGMSASLKGKHKDNGLRSDTKTFIGGKQGALTGSIFSQVPAVLVEMVVLTNPKDEAWITSKDGRLAMVRGLEAGVKQAVPLH